MSRVNMKGGAWTNSEDEVLKAGIMKYGLNKWASIASLLPKKTPKQCKARWTKWLNPHIRKTEWSREEEETLLYLVKIFPSQWNTISSRLNRTAEQCLERYRQLSDAALGLITTSEDNKTTEFDVRPETKPARPDAIDMNEVEMEMLAEAKARLVNTRGKKDVRRAREKYLEDARRLAQLQKFRELKAAGIENKMKAKKGVDHSEDIIDFHAPKQGSFGTGKDKELEEQLKMKSFVGKKVSQIEGESKEAKEARLRQMDKKKDELRKKVDLKSVIEESNKRIDFVASDERKPLSLPAPKMTEAELRVANRLGVKKLEKSLEDQSSARLQGQSHADLVKREVKLITTLQQSGNIFEEGEDTGSSSTSLVDTTTTLTTKDKQRHSEVADLKRKSKKNTLDSARQRVKSMWSKLPQAKNNFMFEFPEVPDEPVVSILELTHAHLGDGIVSKIEDKEVLDEMLRVRESELKMSLFKKQSQVIQRGLPRPNKPFNISGPMSVVKRKFIEVDDSVDGGDSELSPQLLEDAEKLVLGEALRWLKYDNIATPISGTVDEALASSLALPNISQSLINSAKHLLDSELKKGGVVSSSNDIDSMSDVSVDDASVKRVKKADSIEDWLSLNASVIFDPISKSYVKLDMLDEEGKRACLLQDHSMLVALFNQEKTKSDKLEKNIGLIQGGYLRRLNDIEKTINKTFASLSENNLKLQTFSKIYEHEKNVAIPNRLYDSNNKVAYMKQIEKEQQDKYRDNIRKIQSLSSS